MDSNKVDFDNAKVEVVKVVPFVNKFHGKTYSGFTLEWRSPTIGFGEYTISQNAKDQSKWAGDSEHMDSQDDKSFIRKLLESFVDKLVIEG